MTFSRFRFPRLTEESRMVRDGQRKKYLTPLGAWAVLYFLAIVLGALVGLFGSDLVDFWNTLFTKGG